MIVQRTESCDAQVEMLIFKAGTQTEMNFRHTTAQYHLVFRVYFTVVVYVLIKAVTDLGAFLSGVVGKILLCTGDTFINPTVELADFFTYFGDVCT